MKRKIILIVFCFKLISANAQFDYNYSFWSNAMHPDNSDAEIIKKMGYTNMLAVEYDATADDTTETIKEIIFVKYDKEGRAVFYAPNKNGKGLPYGKYEYDGKGNVKKYTYQEKYFGSQTQYPEEVYEFEYDKSGLNTIKYKGHKNYKWEGKNRRLQFISKKDTVTYAFDSTGNLLKFHYIYKTDKNGIETKTTHYTYNKTGSILSYHYVKSTLKQDTIEFIKTNYKYDFNNALVSTHVERYSYGEGTKFLNREEDYNYINDEKGRTLSLETSSSSFYEQDGEEMTDFYGGSIGYIYSTVGLLIKKEVYNDPGFETVEVFKYSK